MLAVIGIFSWFVLVLHSAFLPPGHVPRRPSDRLSHSSPRRRMTLPATNMEVDNLLFGIQKMLGKNGRPRRPLPVLQGTVIVI